MNVEEVIKTTKPIPLEKRTLIHLMLVHNKVNEAITAALKPYEMSSQQFNVLRILRGQKGCPANLSTLNERMVSKMSNTTRLVDKLIHKGYVRREICETNRRKVEITITDSGKRMLDEMDRVMDTTEQQIVEGFSRAQLEQLNYLLDKF
ncbi:MarR family winged helix-turn-helix transcriptional regulator [Poritiphilus flavus]|uniref:MarR family transcriptional regulator n=1 Tax=Poritiphilus flavus TaxID=2697053 RepID=A0A6L9EAK0_9FLAO|nr:MarR family transcriptional regulator [Poritiphilus flavus]NAS11795.1 MarR family transcriptional regulator [Poritiphilus flavus]